MSEERWRVVSPLLDRALELPDAERAAWLDRLRRRQPSLAADVERLLQRRDTAGFDAFLRSQPVLPPSSLAGQTLGAYTLESLVGQGGMGAVWMARRSDGRFEGQAAVKLLNLSLVGRSGEERFRREGTILARFTHRHIARLIDAGVSGTGQPYLILEYVEGEPIDRFCDTHDLDVEERLRLFLGVLDAVAHAHANLIVHRDIKPSNVLVDGNGDVKLLDFGIAKLLQDEADPGLATALTREGGGVLTPEFAAPEQVTGGPITTATDVYALGILLYVLLSGTHPLGATRPSTAEMIRAIVETEPGRPSAVAPERRRRALRGDLDTIVARALKKNPAERYGSVAALADDVTRYLEKKPIGARRDSMRYRAVQFVRRHAWGVATAAAAVLALSGLVGFYTLRLASERDRARREADKATKVSELLTDLFAGADPFAEHRDKEPTVRELLDAGAERVQKELAREPELQVEMLAVIGKTYQRLGLHDRAEAILRKSVAVGRRSFPGSERLAENLNNLGVLLRRKGDLPAATPVLEEALSIRRKVLDPNDEKIAITLVELGRIYGDQGLDERAEPLFREALSIRRRVLGAEDHNIAVSLGDLAFLLRRRGDLSGAEALFRQALEIFRKASGPEHPDVASTLFQLALLAADRDDWDASERLFRQCIAMDRRALGENHPDYAFDLVHFSRTLLVRGKYDEAAADAEQGLRITEATSGKDHPLIAFGEIYLAEVHLARKEPALAEPLVRDALRIRAHTFRSDDWRVAVPKSVLGETLTALGRYDEAESLLLQAGGALRDIPGLQAQEARENRARLARLQAIRNGTLVGR